MGDMLPRPTPPGAQTQFAFVNGMIVALPANQPLPRGAVPAFAPVPQNMGPTGYTGSIRVPDSGYTSSIRVPDSGYTGSIRVPDSGYTGSIKIPGSGYTGTPTGGRIDASSPGQRWLDTLLPDEQIIWKQGMDRGDSAIEVMNRIGKLRRARNGRGGGPTTLTEDEKRAAIALDKRIGRLQKQDEPEPQEYDPNRDDSESTDFDLAGYYEGRRQRTPAEEEQRLRARGPMVKPQKQTADAAERRAQQEKKK